MILNKIKIYAILFTCILSLIFSATVLPADANITIKLKETRRQINQLKQKEVIEKNKLYSNQLKKEKAENELK